VTILEYLFPNHSQGILGINEMMVSILFTNTTQSDEMTCFKNDGTFNVVGLKIYPKIAKPYRK
jgi:hypothetical protein